MVKLYNLSGLPDDPLYFLLLEAQQLAGATGSVVVKVTRGGYRVRSYASSACAVRKSFLSARQCVRGTDRLRKGWIKTSGGYVVMQPHRSSDPLTDAQRFFETAIHEFAHVYDFQHGGKFALAWSKAGDSGRRPDWAKRPEELRAINRTDDALARLEKQSERKGRITDSIIAMAIQMEAKRR